MFSIFQVEESHFWEFRSSSMTTVYRIWLWSYFCHGLRGPMRKLNYPLSSVCEEGSSIFSQNFQRCSRGDQSLLRCGYHKSVCSEDTDFHYSWIFSSTSWIPRWMFHFSYNWEQGERSSVRITKWVTIYSEFQHSYPCPAGYSWECNKCEDSVFIAGASFSL